jgi:electron transfer flavoprotein alpha subunit
MPYSAQVGQSGRTVSPDLYIAFGVSGSVQHMAGLRAKRIISVNKDRSAPLNAVADKAIIGDADSILRSMLESLEE